MAVWPSLKVVNSCARAIGRVLLRGITFSTKPPMVSKPSDSGMTSSNNKSASLLLPASVLACMAAPSATTLSGSKLVSGVCLKKSATAKRICGMRVAPPTITTPLISSMLKPASRKAFLVGLSVLATKVWVNSLNFLALKVKSITSPVLKTLVICALAWSVSHSLASRALVNNNRVSLAFNGLQCDCSNSQQKIRRSKSSPPSALSPLVLSTSNTPLLSFNIETSNVPPPKS